MSREDILFDLKWLKNELKDLTNEERCLILTEYVRQVKDSNIDMVEYVEFMKVLSGEDI